MKVWTLETDRLILRQWKAEDLPVFAELNADAIVMEHFPRALDAEGSDALAEGCRLLIAERGWGFWAVSLKDGGGFIGFVGLNQPKASLPFSPCVEIGWRLHRHYWGKGYATEAGRAGLDFAFRV